MTQQQNASLADSPTRDPQPQASSRRKAVWRHRSGRCHWREGGMRWMPAIATSLCDLGRLSRG